MIYSLTELLEATAYLICYTDRIDRLLAFLITSFSKYTFSYLNWAAELIGFSLLV